MDAETLSAQAETASVPVQPAAAQAGGLAEAWAVLVEAG
jgi:hypothetical protein